MYRYIYYPEYYPKLDVLCLFTNNISSPTLVFHISTLKSRLFIVENISFVLVTKVGYDCIYVHVFLENSF